MIKKYMHSSPDKLKWFGPGEWVGEPDEVTFENDGFVCRALRIVDSDDKGIIYGGHWCGYVRLPEGHAWINKEGLNIDCDIHGGITFTGERFEDIRGFWVGFDCAHASDILPSVDNLFSENYQPDLLVDQISAFIPNFTNKTYKNIDFVINELKSLAEKAKQAI